MNDRDKYIFRRKKKEYSTKNRNMPIRENSQFQNFNKSGTFSKFLLATLWPGKTGKDNSD